MANKDDELIRKSNVVAIVYDPPQKGFPHLTTIFIDGKVVVCEPVASIEEGEAVIEGSLPEIPDLFKTVRQKARLQNAKH